MVQVSTDAKTRPIITAFTMMSAAMNMPHGVRSRGRSAGAMSIGDTSGCAWGGVPATGGTADGTGAEIVGGAVDSAALCACTRAAGPSNAQQTDAVTSACARLRGNTKRLLDRSPQSFLHISLITMCIPELTPPVCWRFLTAISRRLSGALRFPTRCFRKIGELPTR
jgi:hypothetical protein